MYGIAAVRAARVVEVDYIELRLDPVPVRVVQQMVVGDGGKVGIFKVIDILTKTFLNLLLYEGIYHGIRLSAARRTQHDGSTERVYHVDKSVVPLLLIVKAGGQIDGILVLHEAGFLHETLVLDIEHVFHEVGTQETAHPCARHEQADIARRHRSGVETGDRLHRKRQGQYPPVKKEQHKPGGKHRPNPAPSDFFLLDAFRAEARKREQQKGKELCVEDMMEQPCGAIEVHQHPVHDTYADAPQPYGFITIPVEVDDHQNNAHGTEKVHAKTHKDGSNYSYLCIKQIKVRI